MDQEEALVRLLRLKRYEQPPEGFHETFLRDFHRCQRQALLKTGPWKALWHAICDIWPNYQVPRLAYAGCAAAAVGAGIFLHSQTGSVGPAPAVGEAAAPGVSLVSSASRQPASTIGETIPASAGGTPSRHYVLEPRPSSVDRPLSF